MKDYFRDPRFQAKKPKIKGDWQQRCGDNIYDFVRGQWVALRNPYHKKLEQQTQDTRHPFVFVGTRYWYLGKERAITPPQFLSMIGGRGARVNHPPALVGQFKAWVQANFKEGITAMPLDSERSNDCIPPGTSCNTRSETPKVSFIQKKCV
jgi:hypothetical protein